MRAVLLALMLAAAPAFAQDAPDTRTLADLRAELRVVAQSLQALRAELNASGGEGFAAAGGDAAIDRMNAMERDIAAITGRLEQLQNQVGRVVSDGTRRISDIEFRLCEMDPGCDLGALMSQPELGSLAAGTGEGGLHVTATPQAPDSPLTPEDQAALDAAAATLAQGDAKGAAAQYADLAKTRAGSPVTAEALFRQGEALTQAEDAAGAGAAFLQSFAASPNGPRAADALLGLAGVLSLGPDPSRACLYLAEVPARFPDNAPAVEAAARRSEALNCASAEGED